MTTTRIDPRAARIPVHAISTSNLTLSGAQTVDTVALTAGMLCGALGQSNNKSGVYLVQAGAWIPVDPGIGTGLEVYAVGGSANVNAVYGCDTTGAITWGTTSTTFTLKSAGGGNITGAVVTATTEVITPTIGPDDTHQHTLPAVTSGTVLVSGSSSIPDATLSLGDASHRLVFLGVENISSGTATLVLGSIIPDGSTAVGASVNCVAFQTGGSAAFVVQTAGTGTPELAMGCPSLGQSDALCWAEKLGCTGAVTAGQVVVWSGTKKVSAAGASAGLTTIAGVALTTGTDTDILVARKGRVYTNADAGIVAGTVLKTSGAVAGNVVDGAAIAGGIVGRACEATSGTVANKVLVDLILG